MERILTEEERWVILNALTTARLCYEADMAKVGHERLERQLRMQIADCNSMYDLIEQADAISLAPPETIDGDDQAAIDRHIADGEHKAAGE